MPSRLITPGRSIGEQTTEWRDQVKHLDHYYLGHHWTVLLLTDLLVALAATAVAWIADHGGPAEWRAGLLLGSTTLLVLAFLGNELVVAFWRRQRNRALAQPAWDRWRALPTDIEPR